MDKFEKFFYGTVAVLVTTVLLTLLRAWVLVDLWHWFVEPLGVRGIGLAHAVGISLIVAYLTHQPHLDEDERRNGVAYIIVKGTWMGVTMPLMAWGFGWAAHTYMAGG